MNHTLQHITLVAGTHGNEWGGIYLYELWHDQPHLFKTYPFEVECYLANPKATQANQRYVDQDLNRSFSKDSLNQKKPQAYEAQRASTIAQELHDTDFLIDLHNTTSNMGISLILTAEDAFKDELTRQLCAHLSQDPLVNIYYMPHKKEENPHLPGLAQRNLIVEVGPMAHGTLDAQRFMDTRLLIQKTLDYLSAWQNGVARRYSGKLTIYKHVEHVDYPRRPNGKIAAMVHPERQFKDYEPMKPGDPLFMSFTGATLEYTGEVTRWPVFVNEQSYYEKGVAMSLTEKTTVSLEDFGS